MLNRLTGSSRASLLRASSRFMAPARVAPYSSYQNREHQNSKYNYWKLGGAALGFGLLYQGVQSFSALQFPSDVVPEFYPYVLIGTGPAVLAAAAKIREDEGDDKKILIVGEFKSVPYTRKALTAYLIGKEDEIESIDKQSEDWFEETNIEYMQNKMIWNFDPIAKMIQVEKTVVSYDKCLIASGSRPILPEFDIEDGAPVSVFHKLEDIENFRNVLKEGNKTIAVIGDDSWSCTVSAIISKRKKSFPKIKVKQFVTSNGILPEILPPYLSEYAAKKQNQQKNIEVVQNATVAAVRTGEDNKAIIELKSGESVTVDHVLIVPQVVPNTGFVGPIEVDNSGVIANIELQVQNDLYAAGEAASHYNPGYGRRTLLGENNEILSGRIAGANMTSSKPVPYNTDVVEEYRVADVKFNVIGRCDPSLRTHSVWLRPLDAWDEEDYKSDEYQRGIVYYLLPNNRIVGVVLWNMPDPKGSKEDRAITVIQSRRTYYGDTPQTAIVIGEQDMDIPKKTKQAKE